MKNTMTTTKTKNYYAMTWQNGQVYVTNTGKRWGVTYYRFDSARLRAAWCAGGGANIFSSDYREDVPEDDRGLIYEINSKFGEIFDYSDEHISRK